jgi:thiol-disulfide isomerase/thioredoxin
MSTGRTPEDGSELAVDLPDGLVAVVKSDCPTCIAVVPVLESLSAEADLTVVSQDESFPLATVIADMELDVSWRLGIETVPTLLHLEGGKETARTVGWDRRRWEELTGVRGLGPDLPDRRPGCGSRTLDPGVTAALDVRHRGHLMHSRRVRFFLLEDDFEAMHDRGWTDGLPVVPPTEARVLAMLDGTQRPPEEVVAVVPPNLVPVTVEKVAVNAVMAGCRPEYLPVVLAAVEAACTDEFNIHGVLATTWSVGPALIVSGPASRAIGLNHGVNVLGQGTRANSTIGRALQLVVRNIGGGRPGGVDRATFGNPGKVGLCIAEDEEASPWKPLSEARGLPPGTSSVTVVAAGGMRSIADQESRTPEGLLASLVAGMRGWNSVLIVSPDHGRLFRDAGWSRNALAEALENQVRGGIGLGTPSELLILYAGGSAGLFSAVMEGWVPGAGGSIPVTVPVRG